jgi:hypothetical protein
MGYRLNAYVHAVEYDDKGGRTGREQVFGPDDNLSAPENEWALTAISNPDVWVDGNAPKRKPAPPVRENDEVARLKARVAELEQEKATAGQSVEAKAPARSGPGSGADKWRAYAAAQGVEVDLDASRDDVIAALHEAGKPTE